MLTTAKKLNSGPIRSFIPIALSHIAAIIHRGRRDTRMGEREGKGAGIVRCARFSVQPASIMVSCDMIFSFFLEITPNFYLSLSFLCTKSN